MKNLFIVVLGIAFLACSLRAQTPATAKTAAPASSKKKSVDEGERRFQQNCSRCHNPPDSLSSREVKAVLQHMRLRASLTAEDERLILKYLAP